MVEVINPSPLFYGVGGAPISSQDGASIRLEGSGAVHVSSSITEQGQGTEAIMQQIAADQLAISYYKSFELPVKIVRPFNTYGPRQSSRAIIPTIISQILSNVKKNKSWQYFTNS